MLVLVWAGASNEAAVRSLGAGKRERVGTSPGTGKPTAALKRTGLPDA
jgi:hypothetical protein